MRLSIVMPYYRNPTMLGIHYAFWAGLPDWVKRDFEVVIVDDGSPDEAAVDVPRPDGLPALRIFRVLEDRPWHQHAARNIGAHEARGEALLLTDMDHLCTQALIEKACYIDTADGAFYVRRVEFDTGAETLDRFGKPKSHPNTFVMSRELFWKIGGYDEDFCGVYGTDGLFRHRMVAQTTFRRLKGAGVEIRRLTRDMVHDASTRDVVRKEGRDPKFRDRIFEKKRRLGRCDKIVTLSMPYRLAWPEAVA